MDQTSPVKSNPAEAPDAAKAPGITIKALLIGSFRGAAVGTILFGLLAVQIMLTGDMKGGEMYFNGFSIQVFLLSGIILGMLALRDPPGKKKSEAEGLF